MRLVVALAMPLAVALLAQAAAAVVLLDAELVPSGSPALENASGTVRLEQGRLDAVGRRTYVVPEPGALWQLGSGIALLLFLAKRRAQHAQKEDAMTKKHFRFCTPLLAILLMCLAAPALAQVPQDMTYTGRLVNDRGKPLAGFVNMELRIFDAEISGTQLYSEQHLGVPLDATGGFSVQLGLGTSPSGTFDASLFSEVDRWLEVAVDGEILAPRQIIGSVPWALVAERVAPNGESGSTLRVFDALGTDVGLFMGFKTAAEMFVYEQSLGVILTLLTREIALNEPQLDVSFSQLGCVGNAWGGAGNPRLLFSALHGDINGPRFFYLAPNQQEEMVLTLSGSRSSSTCTDTAQSQLLVPVIEVPAENLAFLDGLVGPLSVGLAPTPEPAP